MTVGEGESRRTDRPRPHRLWSRPLLWLTMAFAAGIAVQRSCPFDLPQGWGTALLVLLPASFVPGFAVARLRHPALPLLLFVVLGFTAGSRASADLHMPPSMVSFLDRPDTLFLAEISAPPDILPERVQLCLELREAYAEGRRISVRGGVLLTLRKVRSGPAVWVLGDRLLARLTLKRFHNFQNPGAFDYVRSQAERGLYARAHLPGDDLLVKLVPEVRSFPRNVMRSLGSGLDRFRQGALGWLYANLAPDPAAFYGALLLGYRVPKKWTEPINRTGVSHLLSISGFHLGLVSMCAFWAVRRLVRFTLPQTLRRTSDQHPAVWVALLAAVLYALISGLALPTWRSIIMLFLVLGATFWYRFSDSCSALAAAALLILLLSPTALWQVSFQLSFAAMIGLFVLYPRFNRFQSLLWSRALPDGHVARKILHPFVDAFWVSMACNVMVLPLLIFHFNGISLAGFAANAVLVPFVGFLVLQPGLAALGTYVLHAGSALPLLMLGGWFLARCQEMILWLSRLSWAYFYVGSIPLDWVVAFYLGLTVLLVSWRNRVKAAVLAGLALVLAAGRMPIAGGLEVPELFSRSPAGLRVWEGEGLLRATILDVGQGTSILVQFPDGKTMLVDGGGFFDDSYDVGRSVVAPFLWACGIRTLDYVLVSHDHPDHRNGLRFILSHFRVGELWQSGIRDLSAGSRGSDMPDELSTIADRRGIPVRGLSELSGERAIGSCRARVLHPGLSYLENDWDGKDLNNVSVVVRIDFGSTHLFLPGDIDRSVERYLFEKEEIEGDVVLVSPHHGSDGSNSPVLLDRLHPRAMIISCGHDNRLHLPSESVLRRCRERSIPCYRTDESGAIRVLSDGRGWRIESMSPKAIER